LVHVFLYGLVALLSQIQPDLPECHPNAADVQEANELVEADAEPGVHRSSLTSLIVVRYLTLLLLVGSLIFASAGFCGSFVQIAVSENEVVAMQANLSLLLDTDREQMDPFSQATCKHTDLLEFP